MKGLSATVEDAQVGDRPTITASGLADGQSLDRHKELTKILTHDGAALVG